MASQDGADWASGVIIGIYSVGSVVTGLAYGKVVWHIGALNRYAVLAVAFLPLAFVPSTLWLAAVALFSGASCAPLLIAGPPWSRSRFHDTPSLKH